jgi:Lrp/AsnC family leucine-responsive transcriptional regulator
MKTSVDIDAIDRRILGVLLHRAEIANNALADEVGLTPGPCLRRVQRLRELGVIRQYTIRLDNKLLGFEISAFVEIALEHHTTEAADRFMRAIAGKPQVLSCHMTIGDCDFLLHILVRDLEEYRQLIWEDLHCIEGVKKIRSTIILDTLKEELHRES